MLLTEHFSAQNAPNSVWRLGDPLGELTVSHRPPSWIKGSLVLREYGGKGVERGEKRGQGNGKEREMGRGGRWREKEGKVGVGPPFMDPRYAHGKDKLEETKNKTVEQSRVREGSPVDGKESIMERNYGKGIF